MRVLVTGATGFLGRTVARRLAARGHALRVLARPSSRLEGLPDGFEVAAGDVTDALSVRAAAEGCAAVVHMAALVKIWVPEPELFEAVNVGGLENVLAAARAAGARLVYTSSFIALGPSGPGALDASRPHPGPPFRNAYERTKARADARAREAAAEGQDVVTLYPGVIYGPGEMTEGNIVARMIADHLSGRLPALVGPGDRRWSYAFVEDVAEGHVLALEKGRPGDRFVLGGENATLARLFGLVHEITAAAPPRWRIPYGIASGIGRAQWLWAELTGQPPQLTHGEVGVFREEWACDSGRAEQQLGYAVRTLAEGLRETIRWLYDTGQAPRPKGASAPGDRAARGAA
ncbi:MAG TPA: NAD-dependent epimerase/dehydratase family protein [Vicinamibacteria bacterium]|nr:NAD-dependent epimerase/dehydratase family protein [Vicinamibacteria bacterium]